MRLIAQFLLWNNTDYLWLGCFLCVYAHNSVLDGERQWAAFFSLAGLSKPLGSFELVKCKQSGASISKYKTTGGYFIPLFSVWAAYSVNYKCFQNKCICAG